MSFSASTPRLIPARLIDVKEMSAIVGLEVSTLQRVGSRRRLEKNGCPPPIMTNPLKWSALAIEGWINGHSTSGPSRTDLVDGDERAAWRGKLTEEYGGAS